MFDFQSLVQSRHFLGRFFRLFIWYTLCRLYGHWFIRRYRFVMYVREVVEPTSFRSRGKRPRLKNHDRSANRASVIQVRESFMDSASNFGPRLMVTVNSSIRPFLASAKWSLNYRSSKLHKAGGPRFELCLYCDDSLNTAQCLLHYRE